MLPLLLSTENLTVWAWLELAPREGQLGASQLNGMDLAPASQPTEPLEHTLLQDHRGTIEELQNMFKVWREFISSFICFAWETRLLVYNVEQSF